MGAWALYVTDMKRLGLNRQGYAGEHIDIQSVLDDIASLAPARGWVTESIPVEPGMGLTTLSRPDPNARRRIYLSTGIHGDEPAGPLAARQLLEENAWPDTTELWLCPCLNPAGFRLRRRENARGVDLNRQYLRPEAPETQGHIAWLERQPTFDVALCLHEDWEAHGFYLYELNPEGRPSHAEAVIERVAAVCPIDTSDVIEGRPARRGIIRPDIDPRSRPDWPEAFWLLQHKTRHSYTLEAPSDFPLAVRVAALVTAVRTILEEGTAG